MPYKLPPDQAQWYQDWKISEKGKAWLERKGRAIARARVLERASSGTFSRKEMDLFMSAGIKFHKVSHFLDSSSNLLRLPHIGSEEVRNALKQIGFKIPFKPTFSINHTYDIPYLCGYDTREDLAYFDKDFEPRSYSEGDATKTLLTHEEVEKKLESIGESWNYQQRHHIATHCERLCVDYHGWNWNAYTRWTTHEWHKAYAKWRSPSGLRCPGTLDMSPYVDEDDSLVKAMRKAGAKDAGKE